MRTLLIAFVVVTWPLAATAQALLQGSPQGLSQQSSRGLSQDGRPTKPLAAPAPKQSKTNPCAAFGPGFVQVEGSATCVRLGGSIGVGVGVGSSSRR
ncbi:hypothetical protein SR870_07145 [Rhodopseudomonas palustris]|uniref:hypothetical protein n=1 Tax=Rhodopseudomonas palustris TaxID=1076 RepID=UPI002ACEB4B4|nr:hypothetical protein [Rhodopseudomonas palustris]WQH01043.1 hypothetical protein SR870_07145 [Rhodopseudomonas palustris]